MLQPFLKLVPIMKCNPLINLTIVGKTKPVTGQQRQVKIPFRRIAFIVQKLGIDNRIKHYPRLELSKYSELLSDSHITSISANLLLRAGS